MSSIRRASQIILAVIAIIGLVSGLSLFYPIPYVSAFVEQNILAEFGLSISLAFALLLVFIYCLVLFIHACFAPAKLDEIVIDTEVGELSFAKEALESTALHSIRYLNGIKNIQSKALLIKSPINSQIRIKFEVNRLTNIIGVGKNVQTHVKNAVETMLGIPIKAVQVEVKQLKINNNQKNGRQKNHRPRVQ